MQTTPTRFGRGFQVNYTLSKSLDDVSAVLGSLPGGSSGALQQTQPQNPSDKIKGPSKIDVRHVVALSLVQELPFDRWWHAHTLLHTVTSGWQFFSVSTLASGSPFTIYSGIQQTGAGSGGVDRPDQIGAPVLSINRTVREDYFGLGASNASFFFTPIT